MNKQIWLVLSLITFLFMSIPFQVNAEEHETELESQIRIVHASPDAPAVDVYVNKDKILKGMNFKEVSTYLPVEEGTYDIKIYPKGSKPKKTDPVLEESVTVMEGEAYTLAVSGKLADITLSEFKDDLTPINDEAKLRVIHLSPDAPKVDIYSIDTPVFTEIAYSEDTKYQNLPEGDYSIDIRPAGQEKPIFNIPNLKLEKGKNYTAIATGLLKGDPAFDVIIAQDR